MGLMPQQKQQPIQSMMHDHLTLHYVTEAHSSPICTLTKSSHCFEHWLVARVNLINTLSYLQ